MILVLIGILDPPGLVFSAIVSVLVVLVISYRLLGNNGVFGVVAILSACGVLYGAYLFVMSVLGWADETNRKFSNGEYDVQLIRIIFAVIVVFFQALFLAVMLAKASDEKRTPFGLLKGYLAVVMISGVAIALAPIPWGVPYLLWGGGVTFTSLFRVTKVVGLTTNYFKPKGDGNRTIAVHDDGAISGSLSDLIWGHMFAFIVATVCVIGLAFW